MLPRPLLSRLVLLFAMPAALGAQTVIESRFLPSYGAYSDPANWSPAEVPNNTADRHYNVTANFLRVDMDATISNLSLIGGQQAGLQVYDQTFTVEGTTLAARPRVGVISRQRPSSFNAGTLSAFSNGRLAGEYGVVSYEFNPATLRLRGRGIVALENAQITLEGAASRIVDENGNDALRTLAEIDAASRLTLEQHIASTESLLAIDGTLELKNNGAQPTIFHAAASLANFEPATKTLAGGTFLIGAWFGEGLTEFRFARADIVNNGTSITLSSPGSRIADSVGLDALRNFSRNLAGGSFNLEFREFATAGDFTNEGSLSLAQSTFTVGGTLTNFERSSGTLRGGRYTIIGPQSNSSTLPASLRFRGADIVRNDAYLDVERGSITDEAGNDALRNLSDNGPSGTFLLRPYYRTLRDNRVDDFVGAGNFRNAGRMEIQTGFFSENGPFFHTVAAGFRLPSGATFRQTEGSLLNRGLFAAPVIDIEGGLLNSVGSISGNVAIGNASVVPGGSIAGSLTLSSESRVRVSIGERSSVSAWRRITGNVALDGTLEVTIRFENYLAHDAALTLLQSDGVVTGNFANAPDGTRLPTTDGSGSFVVRYDGKTVKLTQFQTNPPAAQLLNISTRGYLKEAATDVVGHRHLIGGFIITGVEPKTIIARGVGPSLARRGVTEPLNDPKLGLHQSGVSGPIATNDNWGDTGEIDWSGLAPEDSRESAMKVTLAPGAYTVVMEEAAGLAGTGLIEIYDVSPRSNSKLGNLSTRGFFETGDVLIGGIIVAEGEANADVVVRALGPTLQRQAFYLNAVGDPTLEVRDNNGELLAFDDGETVSGESGGVPRELAPFFNEDCAMRLSLPRGNYTALVRSKRGSRGAAIVEFYDLRR
ncbi:MAG: hypothetical protein H0W20_16160 [Chthoniobacterales bacterium]|nr:hypothetical protein [Chthoniobacterales bacterium]